MTSLLDQPGDITKHEAPDLDLFDLAESELGSEHVDLEPEDAVSTVRLGLSTVSAVLSGFGAAWMIGGVFRGEQARLVAMMGVLLGGGLVYGATRFRLAILQFLVLPASLLAGAALVAPAAGAGTSSLPALVKDAATSAQILQPPIDFAPGWRLILLVVLSLLTAAGVSLSLSFVKPRLAVVVPVPLTIVAALIQPPSSAIVTSAISVGFVMMSLATSYAADGTGDSFDRSFELRRLARSAATGVALVVALVLASQLSFLFPNPDQDRTVPPQRPPAGKPQPDVPLFTVRSDVPTPLRLGVIDVYSLKEKAWLLPPVDTKRLKRLDLPADLPVGTSLPSTRTTFQVEVNVEQATGHLLPDVAGANRAEGRAKVDYDPRTQTLSLAGRPVFTDLHYTLTAPALPSGAELSDSSGPLPASVKPFLEAPPVPPSVQDALAKAPTGSYARVQYIRTALYRKFIAAGAGKPTDVSADRVVELLAGGTGNPYELTASEALLTRWAGVPARIGYGYYGGAMKDDGTREIRPNNAATYLEAYFPPYGWIPIVGTPPQAQASLSNNQRNSDPNIQASNELGIVIYLPARNPAGLPLYAYARYYLIRVLPVLVLGLLLVTSYPVLLKRIRRRRRRQWAGSATGRIALAYCDLRDAMIDLGLPGRDSTPLEMCELVEDDEEHQELAWLVTRGLWGDLRDSVSERDAETAERLSDSVRSRLVRAQPETARLLAAVSRASLREPYSREVPNVWWEPRVGERVRSLVRVKRRRPATAMPSLLVLLAVLLSGCSPSTAVHEKAVPFPTLLAPTQLAGLSVHEEPKATAAYLSGAKDKAIIVSEGKVLSMSKDGLVQAALQVAQLKPGYTAEDPEVVSAITRSVGNVTKLKPAGSHDLFGLDDASQRIYLWFPTSKSMALLVVRAQISAGASEVLARSLIGYGDGMPIDEQTLDAAFSAPAVPAPSVAPTPSSTP